MRCEVNVRILEIFFSEAAKTSHEDIGGLVLSLDVRAMQTAGVTEFGQQYPVYPQYWWPADQPCYHQQEEEQADGPSYRGRCNTWPSSQSWSSGDSHSPGGLDRLGRLPSLTEETGHGQTEGEAEGGDTKADDTPYGRKNPWGPFSYAQLITQAICSQPDQRMTLNQIYEFLISNFPYFAERRSHQKSAGWKVKTFFFGGQWLKTL